MSSRIVTVTPTATSSQLQVSPVVITETTSPPFASSVPSPDATTSTSSTPARHKSMPEIDGSSGAFIALVTVLSIFIVVSSAGVYYLLRHHAPTPADRARRRARLRALGSSSSGGPTSTLPTADARPRHTRQGSGSMREKLASLLPFTRRSADPAHRDVPGHGHGGWVRAAGDEWDLDPADDELDMQSYAEARALSPATLVENASAHGEAAPAPRRHRFSGQGRASTSTRASTDRERAQDGRTTRRSSVSATPPVLPELAFARAHAQSPSLSSFHPPAGAAAPASPDSLGSLSPSFSLSPGSEPFNLSFDRDHDAGPEPEHGRALLTEPGYEPYDPYSPRWAAPALPPSSPPSPSPSASPPPPTSASAFVGSHAHPRDRDRGSHPQPLPSPAGSLDSGWTLASLPGSGPAAGLARVDTSTAAGGQRYASPEPLSPDSPRGGGLAHPHSRRRSGSGSGSASGSGSGSGSRSPPIAGASRYAHARPSRSGSGSSAAPLAPFPAQVQSQSQSQTRGPIAVQAQTTPQAPPRAAGHVPATANAAAKAKAGSSASVWTFEGGSKFREGL